MKFLICVGDEHLPTKQVFVFFTIPGVAACSVLDRLYYRYRNDMAGSRKKFRAKSIPGHTMVTRSNALLLSINLLGIAAIPLERKIHPVCINYHWLGFGRFLP